MKYELWSIIVFGLAVAIYIYIYSIKSPKNGIFGGMRWRKNVRNNIKIHLLISQHYIHLEIYECMIDILENIIKYGTMYESYLFCAS